MGSVSPDPGDRQEAAQNIIVIQAPLLVVLMCPPPPPVGRGPGEWGKGLASLVALLSQVLKLFF